MTKAEIKKLDKEISKRGKAVGICEVCNIVPKQVHPHHYISRRYHVTRWVFANIVVLCPKCHYLFHQHPIKARDKCKLIRVAWWEDELRELSNFIARGMSYQEHYQMIDWTLSQVLEFHKGR